jgi:uncharacterized protein involved in exopolysaccharide biosynthesis
MTDKKVPEDEQISIVLLIRFIMDYWLIISAACIIGAVAGFAVTFLMSTKYEAKSAIAYRNQDNKGGLSGSLSAAAAQFGLGSLGGDQGKRMQAVEILQAKRFIISFIDKQDIKKEIFPDLWSDKADKWITEMPTDNAAYSVFSRKVLSISDDVGRNITEVKMLARTPQLAAQWANAYVDMANEELRREAIGEAQRAVNFLNERLASSNISEVRETLAELLQSNIETAMLANVYPDYAFKIIDPAIPPDPDSPASPNRTVFAAAGFLLGGILATFSILLRSLIRTARNTRGISSL